ncbi:family 78 glycoside hydrolase catalytic domain [Maribellus sp. CM-23]|uniref:family 78 glycoside hydrolase catalytic domain n=1 Tax=Maribellus sp. CM-23 TaxID=2781026 RepID=UPI001F44FDDA|nr:family 78 glycoside hydrolase catalytic domain [Maribellus sp. CM-23]MCE4565896.1 family 78 glycoside hydrolase catalytic domain [Maribellus sp. CM-23]
MMINKIIPILLLLLAGACTDDITTEFNVANLKCEYMPEAVVEKQNPRFSWELQSAENGQRQTAWQLILSDDVEKINAADGSVWDSGKTKGDETFGIRHQGEKLQSFTKYYWKVRAWDKDGKVSNWSEPASFITGAFDKTYWQAKWIGDKPEKPLEYPLFYKHIGYLSSYTDNENEEKWVQIDLGKIIGFDELRLYPSFNNKKEIIDYYFPLAYRVDIGDDGKNWKQLVWEKTASHPKGKPVQLSVENARARYVRFTATKLQCYDFRIHDYEDQGDKTKMYAFSLAELEVISDGKILSVGCKVSYKDALIKIDREDGYDSEMLTDGILDTPLPPERKPIPPSPLLRKEIELKAQPVQAIACVSALGAYDVWFNAQSPDNRILAPEWTDYHKRVQYQVLDVTHLLHEGKNVIGAQLADGWYAGMLGPTRWSPYFPKRGAYGLDRRFFFQMKVKYKNGKEETFVSDGSWKIYPEGPIRKADIFLGETYDARKELKEWQTPGFDDSDWNPVAVDNQVNVNLVAQTSQPIRVIQTIPAKSVTKSKTGHYIFDVGENIAGWSNIQLEGKPGGVIVLRHGEILDEEGELYTENLKAAIQTDSVIFGPSGKLEYEPRFTYHGFRFVEVSGLRETPDKTILEAKVVASDLPRTGHFACSNPMLNQLYKNINRSHMSNMHGVPTDCPQRDERCGWMGDVYIFAQTSMFNRDMAAFYNKWMLDIMDAQSERGTFPDIAPHPFAYEKHFTNAPGWADAAIKLPYLMYLNYGDKNILEKHFEAYCRYIENIRRNNPDLIWRSGLGLNYGDWLNGNTIRAEGFPRTGAEIPSEVFSTIMFYNSVNTLSEIARVIGKEEEAENYSQLAAKIKEAFIKEFVDAEGRIEGDAQSCYAMALYHGLYTDELEEIFEKRMLDKFIPYGGRMNTGFHSTLCLMKELVKRGYSEKAFELLESKEFPSWGYSIEQGATSMWERWDSYVKGRGLQGSSMNSFNHYAFGAIGEWMYANILGIQPDSDSPGYKHFLLKPVPAGTLKWAEGSYHSVSGEIRVKWKRDADSFEYEFTVPVNTTAKVMIPAKSIDHAWEDGTTLKEKYGAGNVSFADGYAIVKVKSGSYRFSSDL